MSAIAVGIRRRCAYTYSVGGDFAVGADGLLSLASAQSNVATLTATVTIEDSHDNTAPVNAFLTLTIAEGGFICSECFRPSLNNLRQQRAVHATPGEFTGRFWGREATPWYPRIRVILTPI